MIITLYKRTSEGRLMVTGHLNGEEIKYYWDRGYRFRKRQFNKHGIEVVNS